jgi:N-acetylglucosaminyldiphosphoundecaprenol N-acetyl-beta-D-mannosaminyltransferase
MSRMTIKFLGLKLVMVDLQEIVDCIRKGGLPKRRSVQLITLNPEMIVDAKRNELFKEVVTRSDWMVSDGVGIILAMRFLSIKGFFSKRSIPKRITGTDLIYGLAKNLEMEGKFFLFGGTDGVAKKASINLKKLFPHIKIVGIERGYNFTDEYIIDKIKKAQPNIILVALGSPKQELWISENLHKMPSVKLAIGVGGAFDYISGKIKRAPLLVREIGLEWMWRLLKQPWRIQRVFRATVFFAYIILKEKYFRSNKAQI